MKRIVILTGSELRNKFFRKYIALYQNIEVINSFREGQEKSLRTVTEKQGKSYNFKLRNISA
jgi:hypothetical protein